MSINKSKNGSYYFWVQYTNPATGNRTRKYKQGFKTKKQAKEAEANFLASIQIDDKTSLTFEALSNDFFKHRKNYLKELTYKNNIRILNKYISPYFNQKAVEEITRIEVRTWIDYLVTIDRSPKYKNDCIELFKSIIKHGRLYFEINNDPTIVIKKFPNPKKRVMEDQVWDIDEFSKFISGFDDCDENEYVYKLFFLTLYFTGARRGEVKALQFDDLNFQKKTISIIKSSSSKHTGRKNVISKPKTESSVRVIRLDSLLMKILNDYMLIRSKGPSFSTKEFIFIRDKDNRIPLADTTIANYRNRICKKTNVKRIRIHDLRHSHASTLINEGINVAVVSKRLGHANIQMTNNVYIHVLPSADEHSIEVLTKLHKSI